MKKKIGRNIPIWVNVDIFFKVLNIGIEGWKLRLVLSENA
jgi:hypothetical protein